MRIHFELWGVPITVFDSRVGNPVFIGEDGVEIELLPLPMPRNECPCCGGFTDQHNDEGLALICNDCKELELEVVA